MCMDHDRSIALNSNHHPPITKPNHHIATAFVGQKHHRKHTHTYEIVWVQSCSSNLRFIQLSWRIWFMTSILTVTRQMSQQLSYYGFDQWFIDSPCCWLSLFQANRHLRFLETSSSLVIMSPFTEIFTAFDRTNSRHLKIFQPFQCIQLLGTWMLQAWWFKRKVKENSSLVV